MWDEKLLNVPPQDWKNFQLHFWIQDQKVWNVTPQCWHLVEIWENLLFHALSNDACKFAINLSPITWGPFENVNLLYFLLKIQIWNGCNVLNIAGNPMKDINVNLAILSVRWKVVECTPTGLEKFSTSFLKFRIKSCGMYPPPVLASGGNLGKSTFPCTVQWCMQICHKPFSHHLRAIGKC